MKKTLFSVLFCIPMLSHAEIPQGNGTWAYDTIYNDAGKKIGITSGLFANKINDFNSLYAKNNHKITQIFSYGGDLEMYCQGAGESNPSEICTDDNMLIFYDKGALSTQAYADASNKAGNPIKIVPIVDGRLDQQGEDDLLSPLNKLDKKSAEHYADKVARLYCKDDNVAGVQFDIEPFDINQSGQAYFYAQIAKDFAGKNDLATKDNDPLGCVNSKYPQGRFFSIFTFANAINDKVAAILNNYSNGYVVDSLYDLGPKQGGEYNTVEEYKVYVNREVQDMLSISKKYGVKFQFAIPAAASAHEFETKAGKSTNQLQINYVAAAFDAINLNKAKADPNYVGIAIWSWNDRMLWQGDEYTPALPSVDMQKFLGDNL